MCSWPRIEAGLEGIYYTGPGKGGGTPDLHNKTSVPGVIRIVISKHVCNRAGGCLIKHNKLLEKIYLKYNAYNVIFLQKISLKNISYL